MHAKTDASKVPIMLFNYARTEMTMKLFNHYDPLRMMVRFGLGGVAAMAIFLAGCASTPPPPMEQFAVTKASIDRATSVGGNEFAPVELRSAVDKMNAAEIAMTEEDYVKAKRLAEQAQVDAQLAETKAALAKAELAVRSAEESDRVLRQEIDRIAP